MQKKILANFYDQKTSNPVAIKIRKTMGIIINKPPNIIIAFIILI